MCIILDANVAHKFTQPPHADVGPVVSWLLNRKHHNQAALGGKLRKELAKAGDAIRKFLVVLDRAGRLFQVPDREVDAEEKVVCKLLDAEGIDDADDPHILALARKSGARLLVSDDVKSRLHELFKNRKFLKPRGKIYTSPSHEPILWRASKCKHRRG
jgi:hypothetical protein